MSGPPVILIVDDDTIHQTVTGAMVKKMGYASLAAYDGLQGLEIFAESEKEIGCILLDIQMPEMNGIEFLRQLRGMGKEVEVIVVSGYLDADKREQLLPLRPRNFLEKPLDFDLLFEELSDCTETGSISRLR